jgi:hypothetical protein
MVKLTSPGPSKVDVLDGYSHGLFPAQCRGVACIRLDLSAYGGPSCRPSNGTSSSLPSLGLQLDGSHGAQGTRARPGQSLFHWA